MTAGFQWSGGSDLTRRSQLERVPELACLDKRYERLPLLRPAVDHLHTRTAAERERLQHHLLERIDHTEPASVLAGFIPAPVRAPLDDDLRLVLLAAMDFLQALSSDGLAKFFDFLERRGPEVGARLRSVLATSCFHHRLPHRRDLPLYLEMGVDLMMGDAGPVLAELQLGYQGYASFHTLLASAYEAVLPDLFVEHDVPPGDFEDQRLGLLRAARDAFWATSGPGRTLVIDAWCAPAHRGGTLRPLADALGAEYVLFDDLAKGAGRSALAAEAQSSLFLYNQPPSYLLDPDDPGFSAERFEHYPDLGYPGLVRDHVRGGTFLTTPAVADVLNDKAIVPFIPAMVAFFRGRELSLPVVSTRELWARDSPEVPDSAALGWALCHQAESVVAHRYLEGGLGIRIGAVMAESEWRTLLLEEVARAPSHFVLRGAYHRELAHSLRALGCGVMIGGAEAQVALSPTLAGRMSRTSPIDNIANGGHCFLCFTSRSDRFHQRWRVATEAQASRPSAQRPTRLPFPEWSP